MFLKPQHLHFTGIAASDERDAEVLLDLGYPISGSDLRLTPITERLAGWAPPYEGHAASNIGSARAGGG